MPAQKMRRKTARRISHFASQTAFSRSSVAFVCCLPPARLNGDHPASQNSRECFSLAVRLLPGTAACCCCRRCCCCCSSLHNQIWLRKRSSRSRFWRLGNHIDFRVEVVSGRSGRLFEQRQRRASQRTTTTTTREQAGAMVIILIPFALELESPIWPGRRFQAIQESERERLCE